MLWLKALVFIIRGNSTAHLNRACSLQKHSITSTVNTGTHRHTKWRCLSFTRPYKHPKKTKILIVFKNVTQDRYTHYSWSISQHSSKTETMGMWLKIFPFRKTRKKIFYYEIEWTRGAVSTCLVPLGLGIRSPPLPWVHRVCMFSFGGFLQLLWFSPPVWRYLYPGRLPPHNRLLGFPLCPETPELGCRFPLTLSTDLFGPGPWPWTTTVQSNVLFCQVFVH